MARNSKQDRETRRGTQAETTTGTKGAGAMTAAANGRPSPAPASEEPAPSPALDRLFLVLEVLLCVVPFVAAALVMSGASVTGQDLSAYLRSDGVVLVEFIAAMAQALVAWILRIVHDHHVRGDGGYALANVIGLLCGELLLENLIGVIGCALILWRLWRPDARRLSPWAHARGVGGVICDVSGALVVVALGGLCTFALARLSALGLVPQGLLQ